jgi:hypothetical protein
MAQVSFGQAGEEEGEEEGVVALGDEGGLAVNGAEEGAGFGWAQDAGMLIALLFGLGGGAERVAGLFGGAEHGLCGEEIGAFGTEAEEAGNAPLVTADGVGAQTGLSEVGGPGFEFGAVELPGRAAMEAEELLPGLESLATGGATAGSFDGFQPNLKGFGPQVEARGGGGDEVGSWTEDDVEEGGGHEGILAQMY